MWQSTVQYSTVTGEDGVRGWLTPNSTLCCGVSVTGAASLVAECGTNIFVQKMLNHFKKNFLGHFQKSVTGSMQIRHGF